MSETLVRIVTPTGRKELALPADVSIDQLLPSVVDAIEPGGREPVEPGRWRLARTAIGDHALAPNSSLRDNGIGDGATLYLSRQSATDGAGPAVAGAATPRSSELQPIGLARRIAKTIAAFGGARGEPQAAEQAAPLDPIAPTAPSPAGLTAPPPLTRRERARQVWRATDYREQLDALVAAPRLARCATVAVVSPKGGVGKTTITSLLGMLLSMLRPDSIVAVDANPDYGSLGRALVPEHNVFVDDFVGLLDSEAVGATEIKAHLGRAQHGLLVLPAPTDPGRMWGLREKEYTRVIEGLRQYAGVVLLDCGTGLQEPAASAAISAADQCILVTDADPAAASLVAEAGQLLLGSGRPITVVVNKMPSARSFLALDRFEGAVPYASAVIVVPNEPHAAGHLTTGRFDWRGAPKSWQLALRKLAVTVTSDWEALGLTVRPEADPGP